MSLLDGNWVTSRLKRALFFVAAEQLWWLLSEVPRSLEMREKVSSGKETTTEDVADWLKEVKEIDKLLRDRLFVLTVAAELGWHVASDMAFIIKVNAQYKQFPFTIF